jgi:hypothetical protein
VYIKMYTTMRKSVMEKQAAKKSREFLTHQEERANASVALWWQKLHSQHYSRFEHVRLEHVKAVQRASSQTFVLTQRLKRMLTAGTGEIKVPRSRGVAEARNELPKLLKEVDQGETFIIRGPKGRETLMIDADVFRSLQEAYFALLGELETRNILENEEAKKSLDAALESDDYETFSEEDLDAE